MNRNKYAELISDHLCWYDPESCSYTETDDAPAPREKGCACEPCLTGRDKLASALAELEARVAELMSITEALPAMLTGDSDYSTGWNDCLRMHRQNRAALTK